jgi:hypothetical protein
MSLAGFVWIQQEIVFDLSPRKTVKRFRTAYCARWLGRRKVTIRKATPNKSLRISWDKGKSDLTVGFYGKDATKSQVTCQHSKLPGQTEVEVMRAFWAAKLQSLKESLKVQ